MIKSDLVDKISENVKISKKDIENVINAFINEIKDALVNGDKISLVGFGTFEVVDRAARIGRNPKTGEEIQVPESKAPKFKPGKALKDAVNV